MKTYTKEELRDNDNIQPDARDGILLIDDDHRLFEVVDCAKTYYIGFTNNLHLCPDTIKATADELGIDEELVNIALQFNYYYENEVNRDRENCAPLPAMPNASQSFSILDVLTMKQQPETFSKPEQKETMKQQQEETMKQQQEETYPISIVKYYNADACFDDKPPKIVYVTDTQIQAIQEVLTNKNRVERNKKSGVHYYMKIYRKDLTDEIMQECFPGDATTTITTEISEHYNGESVDPKSYKTFTVNVSKFF